MTADWLSCGECQRTVTLSPKEQEAAEMLRGMVSDSSAAQLYELDVRRFARLSPAGKFFVVVSIESWRRSGVSVTVSEVLNQVEEVERAVTKRRKLGR